MSVYKFGGESVKKTEKVDSNASLQDYLKRDGSNAATGPLNMGTNKISEVVDPDDDQDVATKKYVDGKTLAESKGKDFILVSGENNKIVETIAKLDDIPRSVRRMIADKTDKITNSKGPGHFVLTGANGELVEAPVTQQKYHQIHTLLQNEINALKEGAIERYDYDTAQGNKAGFFNPVQLIADGDLMVTRIIIGVNWKSNASASVKQGRKLITLRINGSLPGTIYYINPPFTNTNYFEVIANKNITAGSRYQVILSFGFDPSSYDGVSCKIWYKYK